jgi:hypothetical protein
MATTKTAKKTTKKAASKRSAISKRMKEVAAEDKANRAQREAAVAAGEPEVVVPAKPAKTAKGGTRKRAATKAASTAKAKPAKKEKAPKAMSGLDAAVAILAASKEPLNVKAIVEQAEAKGLWQSRTGKTPAATISAAIGREIVAKGKDSRFKKTGRGLFAATGKGA